MITLNGIVGISLLVGASKHRLVSFNASGTGAALATVITLAAVSLVLPGFTTSGEGLQFSTSQLAFAAVASLALYAVVRLHPDRAAPRLLRAGVLRRVRPRHRTPGRGRRRSRRPAARRGGVAQPRLLLVVSLVSVVGLAKLLSPTIESVVEEPRLPVRRRRRRHRPAGARPGVDRRRAQRAARPGADQPEPRLRLGDGLDRPDHPDDRDRDDLARRAARARPRPDPDRAAGASRSSCRS